MKINIDDIIKELKPYLSDLLDCDEGALFVNTCTHSFDQVYKVCKENNYTEYRFIKEDK